MISNSYDRPLAKGHRPRNAGANQPMIVPDDTLCFHGTANIVIGKDKHPVRYKLSTASFCGLVPSALDLRGPENVLREASQANVTLEICGARFVAPVILYCAPDFLSVDAEPLIRLVARAARES
jgi:hypothetical protein